MKKKLIEVALPLEAINKESAREKSIWHGHPSTLHLWWARRPLAACRAVLFASLVDDPSSLPEQFPTEADQDKERQRLFRLIEKLVLWENSNNRAVLDEAHAEILKSTDGNPPPIYDPFCGGGSIPLEAQRLGLEAHGSDLNPVAVLITKALIEIPPKFAGQPPVNPAAKKKMSGKGVQSELTRYLPPVWDPIIEKDIDGPNSLPLKIDRENPMLGRYSAARRVARTLYLGSAPTQDATKKGLEDRQIKLGCVQPGETSGTFGDALRKLADQATYLYVDGSRYWYATQPSVNRMAEERAERYHPEDVTEEIRKRLAEEAKHRGDFSKVHVCPAGSSDVVDEPESKLVILSPDSAHSTKADSSAGRQAAAEILNRGSAGRNCGNMLVFLAADKTRLVDLDKAVRSYLAWKSIEKEEVSLNLTPFQANQVDQKLKSADQAVRSRIPETYYWLLVPGQKRPEPGQAFPPIEWQEERLKGEGGLAERASKTLKNNLLYTSMAGVVLRFEIDQVPLWRGNHVGVKQLVDDFAKYLYLPRVKNAQVILDAIQDGVGLLTWAQDT